MRKLLVGLGLISVLVGCAQAPSPPEPLPKFISTATRPAPEPTPAQPSHVPGPMETELPSGWDEPQDGAPATPDSALSPAELLDLLRLPATAASTHRTCVPDQVQVSIAFVDAATGSRYGYLTVENTSNSPCSVMGYPGFGARGAWGSKFLLIAEQREATDAQGNPVEQQEVILRPGEQAQAEMVWTGELAGAYSEPISMFVVQLASDYPVIGHPVTHEVTGDPNGPRIDSGLDISMLTTVRVGPFVGISVDVEQVIEHGVAP